MAKTEIIAAIKKTTAENGGIPLGIARFEVVTGISRNDWFGKYWSKWGEALMEAGFTPNEFNVIGHDEELLLLKYVKLAISLNQLPTKGELLLQRRKDSSFPSEKSFYTRFGSKADLAKRVIAFCHDKPQFENVILYCEAYLNQISTKPDQEKNEAGKGYVYLFKHGSRKEYKIGKTNNQLRREGELNIELPEKVKPIHVIETDDPAGIENYWHRRFSHLRLNSEWFSLSAEDVKAFKKWKRIC